MRQVSVVLALPMLMACGESSGPPERRPASFALIAGANQTDTVAKELKDMIALRVIATDGVTPVPSFPISWSTPDGGTVFAAVVNSGTDGIARQRWTLGTRAGTQRLVARALDPQTGAVLVDDTVTAEATPAVAARFDAIPTGHGPYGPVADTVAVNDSALVVEFQYLDQYGNAGALCVDGSAPVVWSSLDSSTAVPTGQTVQRATTYPTWFGWVRGINAGETRMVLQPGCVTGWTQEVGVIVR